MEEEDETKSKRVRLDVATKLQIIAAVEGGQLQLDVAKQFGVKPNTVSGIFSKRLQLTIRHCIYVYRD